MQQWLLSDFPIKSYGMLNIIVYDIIQNNFTEIWAVKRLYFMCTSMGQSRRKWSIISLFFQIFIEQSVFHDCIWYKDLETIFQKWNILTLAYIFAYNSKFINNHKEPYLVMLRHYATPTLSWLCHYYYMYYSSSRHRMSAKFGACRVFRRWWLTVKRWFTIKFNYGLLWLAGWCTVLWQ